MKNSVSIYVNDLLASKMENIILWITMQTQDDNGNICIHFYTEEEKQNDSF